MLEGREEWKVGWVPWGHDVGATLPVGEAQTQNSLSLQIEVTTPHHQLEKGELTSSSQPHHPSSKSCFPLSQIPAPSGLLRRLLLSTELQVEEVSSRVNSNLYDPLAVYWLEFLNL